MAFVFDVRPFEVDFDDWFFGMFTIFLLLIVDLMSIMIKFIITFRRMCRRLLLVLLVAVGENKRWIEIGIERCQSLFLQLLMVG
jgi:hypothetical protein